MHTPDNPIPAQLKVAAWPDPVLDALSFLPHDPYSELTGGHVHAGALGGPGLEAAGGHPHAPPRRLHPRGRRAGPALGLGAGTAHHSPMCRTLRRLVAFDLARFVDESTYAVRRRIAPASSSQLCRLSPELRRLHTALLARHDDQRLAARAQPVGKGA